ncbi:flagellar biosynthetic protein FliO [Falsochrobactrum sp. TDYN1]|uniref:Flagellar biosynthetic protein FliO n=1 Tax=Falsochrobactrum tianjinense TaxID=2706015 RepID=A0A949UU42_9HYPH|nr:flagellar biosynthetic protein FliO [Falsochrobactrum sp. TDYN1]MBV2144495.1 flagellar biosynthetic protein FliO [Falsochrobactrum sp. TDYN1]
MKEWLSGLVGESTANIVGFILIFAIILGGIFVVLSIIRRFSGGGFSASGRGLRQPRLSVMDAAAVDSRRKLVLIRRDDVEHLLLIGGPTDVVVEQNITMEPRAQSSRIEPEHMERFRQHEASIASDKDQTIQLNSPIETRTFRDPSAIQEAAPAPQADREAAQLRTPPQSPVTPVAPQVPKSPEAPAAQMPPQPRSIPNYPSQPRTVLPARPAEQQSPRLHPVYPLSQVSRGVLTSTSGLAASVKETPTVAAADLGSITPARETTAHKPVEETISQPVPEFTDDSLEGLGGALRDAIVSDLATESPIEQSANEPEMFKAEDFESELLGSLDITPTGNKSEHSIEDEMEKLLGELTRDQTR